MKLYQNSIGGRRYRGWTRSEAVTYFIKGAARELKIFPSFFQSLYDYQVFKCTKKEQETEAFRQKEAEIFKRKWLKYTDGKSCFDFNGIKLPDISKSNEKLRTLKAVFEDVLLFPCFLNDNYDKYIVNYLDRFLSEGPYGYIDGTFDVTVKKGDIVIDAGAWIGDFSAYAVSKGATAYAFEPVNETYQLLRETCKLNNVNGGGVIYPIQKGLSDRECEVNIAINEDNSGGNSIVNKEGNGSGSEKITVTTLDKFVKENKLKRVDFIKADIEGAERDLLRGASNVLKTFAPKLAICTYHLPDDPEVLEKIIKEANPEYTVVHLRHKLFAAVVKQG